MRYLTLRITVALASDLGWLELLYSTSPTPEVGSKPPMAADQPAEAPGGLIWLMALPGLNMSAMGHVIGCVGMMAGDDQRAFLLVGAPSHISWGLIVVRGEKRKEKRRGGALGRLSPPLLNDSGAAGVRIRVPIGTLFKYPVRNRRSRCLLVLKDDQETVGIHGYHWRRIFTEQ